MLRCTAWHTIHGTYYMISYDERISIVSGELDGIRLLTDFGNSVTGSEVRQIDMCD